MVPFAPLAVNFDKPLQTSLAVPFTPPVCTPRSFPSRYLSIFLSSSAEVLLNKQTVTLLISTSSSSRIQGPNKWTGLCYNGTNQSPIDINSTAASYESMSAFNFENYASVLSVNFTGKNSGHSLKITVPSFKYFVNGGGLTSNFTTSSIPPSLGIQ